MKKNVLNKLCVALFGVALSLSFVSCDPPIVIEPKDETVITEDIVVDTEWTSDKVYLLDDQFIYVKNNATLTIQAGTVIKGAGKGALIITRGAKIMAIGTPSNPIVFTSNKAKGERNYGDWGGLVIMGKATTNKADDGVAGQGKPEGGIQGYYGGTDDDDNSGVLRYVRIEFAGIPLSTESNSEINGLTLYSVGRGTTIDHIQVSYCGDDSFEWFGGTVNCQYLVSYRAWDDDLDTDNGYSGNVQFGLVIRDPKISDQSGSNAFESDNNASGTADLPKTKVKFANITAYGPIASTDTTGFDPAKKYQSALHLRRNTDIEVYNSVFIGFREGLRTWDSKTPANNAVMKGCIFAQIPDDKYFNNLVTPTAGKEDTKTYAQRFVNGLEYADKASLNLTYFNQQAGQNVTLSNLVPQTGSPLLTSGVTTPTSMSVTADYVGAFKDNTNWLNSWTNFNPQQTDY